MKLFTSQIWALAMVPFSLLYGIAVALRNLLYDQGWMRIYPMSVPIIAVGNLTVGGSGKTPLTLKLVHMLQNKGLRVGIISRGYGRHSKGLVIVSDGKDVLVDPALGGDEPVMLARLCHGAVVAVCEERVKAAQELVNQYDVQIIVLDDAFQNRKLYRDLNLLVIHSKEGLGNGSVLPGGPLREFRSGLRRADMVVLSHAEKGMAPPASFPWIAKTKKPVAGFRHEPIGWVNPAGEMHPAGFLTGKRVVAFSGIARPNSFFETVRKQGCCVIREIKFKDHHDYTKQEVETIWRTAEELNADAVVMTQKDQVKMLWTSPDMIPAYALAIDVAFVFRRDLFENQVNAILKTEGGTCDN